MLPANRRTSAKASFGLLLLMVIGVSSAHASSITWTLQNVVFGDGTHVNGSFVFDYATALPASVNLTTTGGSSVPSESNWVLNPNINAADQGIIVVDSTSANLFGAHIISLGGLTDYLDFSSVFALDFFVAGTCSNISCTTYYGLGTPGIPASNTGSGEFVLAGTPIAETPEPSTLLMLGTGLAGLGGVVRRRWMA